MTVKQIDQAHEIGACPLMDEYDAQMAPARQRFDQHPTSVALFHQKLEPDTLETFLIYFSALGVGMTEPVEGWIRQAGQRCGEIGLSKLAKALEAHAHQEADHHFLMQADAKRLVDRWNDRRQPRLNAAALLALKPSMIRAGRDIGYRENS
jgi:hypothetical protein